jgi:predicted Fe-Mo cluster-binding NifX family protein
MKIAISSDCGFVSAHFGRCPQFTILEIEDKILKDEKTIDNPGHHPGFLPRFLSDIGVSAIVAGGMGTRARELFSQARIDTILGIEGKISDIKNKLVAGELEGGPGLCAPGAGKGYGVDKSECDHGKEE